MGQEQCLLLEERQACTVWSGCGPYFMEVRSEVVGDRKDLVWSFGFENGKGSERTKKDKSHVECGHCVKTEDMFCPPQ